jgi:hypothetical protein
MTKTVKGVPRGAKDRREAGGGQAEQAAASEEPQLGAGGPQAQAAGGEGTEPGDAGAEGAPGAVHDAAPRPGRTWQHGFYRKHFTPEEVSLIAEFLLDPTLDDELWMQRVVNRRLLAYLSGGEDIGVEQMVKVAAAMAAGTGRVARLLRDRQALSGDAARAMVDAMAGALAELAAELGRDLLGDGADGHTLRGAGSQADDGEPADADQAGAGEDAP